MSPDLYQLRQRIGGTVYSGGREWVGPGPGHSRRDTSLHVTVKDDGRLLYHSFANDPAEAVRAHLGIEGARYTPLDRKARERAERERKRIEAETRRQRINWCADVWDQTVNAHGSPVETYLRSRGLTGLIPKVLRFHPAAPRGYDSAETCPAMVAIIHGADGSPTGLHVTFLKADGSGKAYGGKSKFIFGYAKGGAVRLAMPAGGALAVAEGIETALSFTALTGTPACAVLFALNLPDFKPPPEVQTLTIAADGDPTGSDAARRLAEAACHHCDVLIATAPAGTDWNDVLIGGAA